jgi:hypothetical protein
MTYDEFTQAMHAGMEKMMRDMHAGGRERQCRR